MAVWTEREVIHLLNRTTFGYSSKDISVSLSLGQEETVKRLIEGTPLVGGISKTLENIDSVKADGKDMKADQIGDQQVYWLYRMVNTDKPLIEKMALFWHGHFATSNQKVNSTLLMVQQNELFRNYALGNFYELLLEVGKDPAMVIWLDANQNRKGKPNENYAREVLELFTLGIGHYTEQDVKETARAFTGWSYNRQDNKVNFLPKQHDDGQKTLLGNQGNLDATSVVDVLFKQKALPNFIARKLLVEFADKDPEEIWVDKVAFDVMNKKTIGEVLYNLFTSEEFYQEKLMMSLIKPPAEYVASIMRTFALSSSWGFTSAMRKMGQELYLPPDVAGWRAGESWLMTSTLLARYQFAESVAKKLNANVLISPDFTPENADSAAEWVKLWFKRMGIIKISEGTMNALSRYAEDTFLHTNQKNNGLRGFLQLILISPEAQMK